MAKVRVDALLARRGLFESRSRAAASVMAGDVLLGTGRTPAAKPGQLVDDQVKVDVRARPPYVSRGGIKLANALARTGIELSRRRALDVGAATGGFTDCLLSHGATSVIALDVAYGELDWRLRNDPRVTVIERCNVRHLAPDRLPYRPNMATIDVSFISLVKVLGPVLSCLAENFDCLALIKPQFEVGRERVGRGGVVRDAAVRRQALAEVGEAARTLGASVLGFAPSGLAGPKGNLETFVWLAEPGRAGGAGAAAEVAAMAAEAEP